MIEEQSVPEVVLPPILFPPPDDVEQAHKADLQRQARELLDASDWRVVRDVEQHGAVSDHLAAYREKLRAVARGDVFELPLAVFSFQTDQANGE
jgi:hypothetical protein